MLASVGPISALCLTYLAPMLTLCWPDLAPSWPKLALSCPYVWPILPLCWPKLALSCPYVDPILPKLALCWPKLALSCPNLALCRPKLALSSPYVGPILALCGPIMSTNLAELCSNTFNMSFFPVQGRPWTPKPRKTRGFLIVPRWISATPKPTKHRKTRCFLTPRAKNTVIYRGSGEPLRGRRQGRPATITFGYQPKASGKGTGQRGRRPDLKAYAW